MPYGTEFLKLLQRALEKQESKLHALADGCARRGLRPSLRSIRQFDEGWIKYLLALEQMDSDQCPPLDFETGRTDAWFLSGERAVAAFELKGPLRASSISANLDKIVKDFAKQSRIVRRDLETYVVLLLHGTESELESCINRIVESARQAARVSEIEQSRDIRLDRDSEVLRICSFKVEA